MVDLALEGVSRVYKKQTVFENVTLQFDAGVHILTGQSGAGKSTLLRLCATAETPSAGKILWSGKSLPGARQALRKSLGYAPQAVDLPLDLTAMEFLTHMAALKGLVRTRAQIFDLLSRLGLEADADKNIAAFSGGMRRRLVLVQAFLGTPSLLVLDEPTAELDEATANRVAGLVKDVSANAIVLLTTHLTTHFSSVPVKNYTMSDKNVRAV